jgi:hypothetical protein
MSIEQQGNALTFLAFYSEDGLGKTGLTVTIDVYRNGSEIVTAGNATAVGDGLYSYTLASGSVNAEGLYAAVFKTATDTVDQQHIPSLWIVGKGGIENLDAAVSSRATPAQVTTIVGAIAGGGGSVEYTQNVTDDDDNPLDGVSVTVRTGPSSSLTPVATGLTDAFGNVTFMLDPGTYYVWCQRAGTNFTNPTEIEVNP